MTISEQARTIRNKLQEFANPRGAEVKIMANMQHLWEELFVHDETPKLLICYTGETCRGDLGSQRFLARVDREWIVVVIRGHGWSNVMADTESPNIGSPNPQDVEPFYDIVEQIRDMIRSMPEITEELPVTFKNIEPLFNVSPLGISANVFLDAYAIRFATANDIPMFRVDENQ